jgi:hypothetical protein
MNDEQNIVSAVELSHRRQHPWCERCGRKANTASFKGNVLCKGCYLSVPKEERDAVDAQMDAFDARAKEHLVEPEPTAEKLAERVECALLRGRHAHAAGKRRKEMPPEYRTLARAKEAYAWQRGWDLRHDLGA